jgi:hypothetical protein
METPVEEYAIGVEDKEERLKPFEQAIRAGRDPEGKADRRLRAEHRARFPTPAKPLAGLGEHKDYRNGEC